MNYEKGHKYVSICLDPYGQKHVSFSLGPTPKREGWEILEVADITNGEVPSDPVVLWAYMVNSKVFEKLKAK